LSITALVPTFAETITVGQVHPAGRRSVRRVPEDAPKCASRPNCTYWHFFLPFCT